MVDYPPESALQLALDYPSLEHSAGLVSRLAPTLARVEIGTPLVLAAGFGAIDRIRSLAADSVALVADVKICDAGERIARSAFSAGANVITAVAAAIDRQTWSGIVAAAADARVSPASAAPILLDTIGWHTDLGFLGELTAIAADSGVRVALCVHRPKDAPGSFPELIAPFRAAAGHPLDRYPLDGYVVAGKLGPDDVSTAITAGFDTLIVGGAIADAIDPLAAWSLFRERVATAQEQSPR